MILWIDEFYILIVDKNVFILFDRKQLYSITRDYDKTKIDLLENKIHPYPKGRGELYSSNHISHSTLLDLDNLGVSRLIELPGRIQFWPKLFK